MQIKPCFSKYLEEWRKPVCKDDRGVQYSLVKFKGIKMNNETEIGVAVLADVADNWKNGAVSYEDRLFWKTKNRPLREFKIEGYSLKEEESNPHCIFWNYPEKEHGISTTFNITKDEIIPLSNR